MPLFCKTKIGTLGMPFAHEEAYCNFTAEAYLVQLGEISYTGVARHLGSEVVQSPCLQ